MLRGLCIFHLFVAASLLTTTASAQTASSDADQEFEKGLEYHDKGQLEEALEHFRTSLALERRPTVWANIIFCLVSLERHVEAIAEYDALIAAEGSAISSGSQAKLEPYMLSIGQVFGFGLLSIDTAMPGVIFLDGKRLPELAPGIPRRVPAGKHVVRLEAPGMAATEETVEVRGGERSRVRLSPRKPFYVEMRFGFIGGGTTSFDDLRVGTNCRVYCFPGLNVLLGARLTIPIKGPFVAEIGGDYIHTYSTSTHLFPDVSVSEPIDLQFSLNAAIAHASVGIDVMRGRLRFQSRIGAGVLSGQSDEEVVGNKDATIWTPSGPLATVHARLGLSVEHRGVWFGVGVEAMTTLMAHHNGTAPTVNGDDILSAVEGKGDRQFGRLVVISPELNVGWSF